GLAKANLGDLGGALRTLGRMQRLLVEYDLAYYRAGVDSTLAWVWRELGELSRARDLAERALEEARSGSGVLELEQTLHALLGVADCCLLDGDQARAATLAEAAVPLLDRRLPVHAPGRPAPPRRPGPGWTPPGPSCSWSCPPAANPPSTRRSRSPASARPTRP